MGVLLSLAPTNNLESTFHTGKNAATTAREELACFATLHHYIIALAARLPSGVNPTCATRSDDLHASSTTSTSRPSLLRPRMAQSKWYVGGTRTRGGACDRAILK